MKSLTDKLKEIRDRADKATPGIWEARCNEFSNTARPRFIWDSTWGFIAECSSGSQDIVNADFIANAKQDIPKLLAVIEKLIEQRDGEILECMKALKSKVINTKDYDAEVLSLLKAFEGEK